MNSSNLSPLTRLVGCLLDGLRAELYLTPKPGLVDLLNNGSHSDLSLLLMSRSIRLLHRYLEEVCRALAANQPAEALQAIGQRAEQRMLEQLGSNCHRGGIFLTGLLLVAARRVDPHNPLGLRQALAEVAGEHFERSCAPNSHGALVRRDFPRSGILREALLGLPGLFEVALPVLLEASPANEQGALLAMARLMQTTEDSTSLFRCGSAGLNLLRLGGHRLESCLIQKNNPTPLLLELDREFQRINLTMGGVADLLGVSLGYAAFLRRLC